MTPDLRSQIVDLTKAYFSATEVETILADIKEWDVDETCLFYQVAQAGDAAVFETAFRAGPVLIDYTFRSTQKDLAVVMIDSIYAVHLSETESATNVNVSSGEEFGGGLHYAASGETYRESLRGFFRQLHKCVAKAREE